MSIASEITRLQTAKAELKASINAKGGTIDDETIDEYASVVDTISTGTDISDANALVDDVLINKTFYATSGGKKTGTMADNGTVNTDITTKAQEVTIAGGKHSGSGKVKISSTEQAKIVSDNIKSGVSILGQEGSLTPAKAEETKTITSPDFSSGNIVVTPTTDKVMTQVTVNKDATNHIPENIKDGITLYGVEGTYEGGGGVTFSGYSISLDTGYGYADFEANILGEYDGSYGWHYIDLRSESESDGFTVSNASLLVIKYVASTDFMSGLGNIKTYDGTSISSAAALSGAVNKLCYLTGNVSLIYD